MQEPVKRLTTLWTSENSIVSLCQVPDTLCNFSSLDISFIVSGEQFYSMSCTGLSVQVYLVIPYIGLLHAGTLFQVSQSQSPWSKPYLSQKFPPSFPNLFRTLPPMTLFMWGQCDRLVWGSTMFNAGPWRRQIKFFFFCFLPIFVPSLSTAPVPWRQIKLSQPLRRSSSPMILQTI